jgi:hypothetical protein
MSKSSDETEFWVNNISDKDVMLSDLRVKIPARRGLNLLSKHYSFTYEQLKESMHSGSIHKKSAYIKVGQGPPQQAEPVQKTLSKYPIITKKRSVVKIEEPKFDEFVFSDEQFAEDMSREFDEEDF